MSQPVSVLIVFYSKYGTTRDVAHAIAEGVESTGATAVLRQLPDVATVIDELKPAIPSEGELYASPDDLNHCDALALGSPGRFGNMAAPVKYFLEQTNTQWMNGTLAGKPACCFTATGTLHGGHEATILSMMLPLFHQGMVLMGLPYSIDELTHTQHGGTPYGAGRVTGMGHDQPFHSDERKLAVAQGKRLAEFAQQLKRGEA